MCYTKCGLIAHGVECAEVDRKEARFVESYSATMRVEPQTVCDALTGWRVEVRQLTLADQLSCKPGSWLTSIGCVAGYTNAGLRIVTLGSERMEALAHELVHVEDLWLGNPRGHCHWDQSVRNVLRYVDHAEPMIWFESTCQNTPWFPAK
jgi:hypothetical protein